MKDSTESSTKDQLFNTAIKVFAKKGYKEATVREICKLAGAANLNSINYYFGGKQKLYKAILDNIFSDYQKRKDNQSIKPNINDPEERLRDFINAYCEMLYSENETAADFSAIFIAEMSRPSPYLDEMANKYMVPQTKELMDILRSLLGEKTPLNLLRDCGLTIISSIGYYGFSWPLLSRIFPDFTNKQGFSSHLADHVFRFSIGGLEAVKKDIASGQIPVTTNNR